MKRQKIEESASSLKYDIIKKASKDHTKTIVSLKTGKSMEGGRTSSKRWSEYSRPHQSVLHKHLVSGVQAELTECDTKIFSPVSVEIENTETGNTKWLI